MSGLQKYGIGELISRSSASLVYRANRKADGQPVCVKRHATGHPSALEVAGFQWAFELGQEASSPGVVRHLELLRDGSGLAIITAALGGTNLAALVAEGRQAVDRTLGLGIAISSALEEIHERSIIHGNLTLGNIVLDEDANGVLIDFAAGSRVSHLNHSMVARGTATPDLRYSAPERTGRTNRAVDSRADLYSLGVCLFQLLTGRLPFEERDPLTLVHFHLARMAERVDELETSVPDALGDVVARLLSKDPEDRYQSARGLTGDLREIRDAIDAGGLDDLELGSLDQSARLVLPQRPYGREAALRVLRRQTERAALGMSGIVAVTGHAGIGKSTVIDELESSIVVANARMIRGRFEQMGRDVPLAAFTRALRDLIDQVSREGEGELAALMSRLVADLGGEATALVDLVPSLREHLGESVESEMDENAVRARRLGAVVALLREAAAQRGVVLVLDDLQWADGASRELLAFLAGRGQTPGVVVVCAWREEEVGAAHPLSRTLAALELETGRAVPRVELGPLAEDTVREFVHDSLDLAADQEAALVTELVARTGGNPFFLRQLLLALYRDGQLAFDPTTSRWKLDLGALDALTPEGVEAFMVGRLGKLPRASFELLQVVAHIGDQASIGQVSNAAQLDESETTRLLRPLLTEGFLRAMDNGERVSFVHDRIQEAAWGSLSADSRADLHWRIAMAMLETLSDVEQQARITEIAGHLAQTIERANPPEFRRKNTEIQIAAARKAIASSAFDRAQEYLSAARTLLGSEGWTEQPVRSLEAALLLSRVRNSQHDSAGVRAIALEAESAGCTPQELVPLYASWFGGAYAKGDLESLIEAGRQVFSRYGLNLPKSAHIGHTLWRIAKIWYQMPNPLPRSAEDLSEEADPQATATVEVIGRILPALFLRGDDLAGLYMSEVALQASKCGRTPAAGFAWATMGTLVVEVLDDVETADQLARLGNELAERAGRTDMLAELLANWQILIRPWRAHLDETLPPMDRCWQMALDTGDSYAMGNISVGVAFHRTFLGINLDTQIDEIDAYMSVLVRHGAAIADFHYLRQYIECLRLRTPEVGTLRGEHFDIETDLATTLDDTSRAGMTLCSLMLAIFYDSEKMGAALELARPERKGDHHIFMRALWPHYAALARLRTLPANALGRARALWEVRRWLAALEKMAKQAAVNVAHRILHIHAERHRAKGEYGDAVRGYAETARVARANRWNHEAGLAHEHACRLLVEIGDTTSARGHYQDASYLYERWGAQGKLLHLQQFWLEAVEERGAEMSGAWQIAGRSDVQALDLETVMRAARAVSSEVELGSLVEALLAVAVENAGARTGTLVYVRDGVPHVEADMKIDESGTETRLLGEAVHGEGGAVPESLVRVALLLEGPRVIDDVQSEKDLAAELSPLRARGARSVLIVPLIRKEEAVGALILGNDLATGIFSPARVRLLEIVAAQAAISLENAMLYDDLQDSLRTEIELNAANRRFVPQEFLASLGAPNIASVALGDSVQKEMTVLFSDVRAFTSLVEGMTPEQNIAFINEYLSKMEPPILTNHGFVDSYIGDAVMALFDVPDDAMRAAVGMLQGLQDLNVSRRSLGQTSIRMGVGVNSGLLTLGTIGGPNRIKCGVIGDCVNLAARLESATKQYGVPLLVGGDSVDRLEEPRAFDLRIVDTVRVVGRHKPVTLYEIYDADPAPVREAKRRASAAWNEALKAYKSADLVRARDAWMAVREELPDDPVVALRLSRCLQLIDEPPGGEWDGIHDLMRK